MIMLPHPREFAFEDEERPSLPVLVGTWAVLLVFCLMSWAGLIWAGLALWSWLA